jgi:PAS domain S-box-containing protein
MKWFENHIYPSVDGLSFLEIYLKRKVRYHNRKRKYFRALVENNQGIITVIDEEFKVVFRSSSSARVTGYSNKEFDAIADEDYYHPDYLEYAHNKNPLNIPLLHYFRSNIKTEDIWLEGVLNNRLDDPSIAGIITNFRDITNQINIELKLKQREQRFQALIITRVLFH